MPKVDEKSVEARIDKIYFKSSVKEMIEAQKVQAIKSILSTVDYLVEPDNKDSYARKHIRKAVLDSINDMSRVFQSMVDSLTNTK